MSSDLVVAVVGPTATGKSDLGVELALRLGGEVVNADASQFYRGMDIGTAKLPMAERRGVPHHQLDVLDVVDEITVGRYQAAARADIDAIRERGHVPILVGGSGLYVRAALDRLEIPPTDATVRARLEAESEAHGPESLRQRLREADPVAAQAIQQNNIRRIIRALEVIEITGRPFSATMPTRDYLRPTVTIGLRAPRPILHERVAARVETMWAAGLLEEVRDLERAGLRRGRTASRAIGYAQALAELDGEFSTAKAKEETVFATRRLVRRQEAWFGPDPRIHWLESWSTDLLEQAESLVRAGIRENG